MRGYDANSINTFYAVPTNQNQDHAVKKGWDLKSVRKSYKFNIAQIEYLQAKLNIGQTTDRQLDSDIAAKEMWRVPDGTRLFSAAEFLSRPQKISSHFSRLATKACQQQVQVECKDVVAVEGTRLTSLQEERPFSRAYIWSILLWSTNLIYVI